jgi:hypothetical protein
MHEHPDNIITQSDKRILRMALSAPVLLVVALAAVQMFKQTTTYKRYLSSGLSGKPVIELTGVVTEYPSGKPVAGAYALVSLHRIAMRGLRAGNGVCSTAQMIRTDAEGRYRFRWDWEAAGLEIPDEVATDLRVYQPGMNYWPRRIWISNIASTQPNVQLSRDDAPFAERVEWLEWMHQTDCGLIAQGPAFAQFERSIHAAYWDSYCGPMAATDVPLDFKTYERIEGHLIGTHGDHWEKLGIHISDDRIHDWWNERMAQTRRAAPTYPWAPEYIYETPPEPRDLTLDEKRQLCAALDPAKLKWGTEP